MIVNSNIRKQKEGWIEENEDKLRVRSIAIEDRNEKEIVTTVSRHLMEHIIEHVKIEKSKCRFTAKDRHGSKMQRGYVAA